MGQWFPALDSVIGGTADAIEDGGGYVLGGLGSTIGGAVTGTTDVAADAAGSFLSPIVGTMFKFAALTLGAVVLIKVI